MQDLLLIEQATAGCLSALRPPRDTWCDACHGQRWWTERRASRGWRCMTCHPPSHLPAEAIRRENEPDAPGAAAPRAPHSAADPLFRQAGIGLDVARLRAAWGSEGARASRYG
jgi:hypothetical protein